VATSVDYRTWRSAPSAGQPRYCVGHPAASWGPALAAGGQSWRSS